MLSFNPIECESMATADNHEPLWPPGEFITLTVEEISACCVEAFPASKTRSGLMADFQLVVRLLVGLGVEGEVWLDGSFVTRKVDPQDIDFVVFASADQYDATPTVRAALDGLVDTQAGWPPASCDTNVVFFGNDIRRFWEVKLGTGPAKGLPKGIVVVRLEKIVGDESEEEPEETDSAEFEDLK